MDPLRRLAMAVIGFAVLSMYTAAAFLGFLVLLWLVSNPPDPLTLLLAAAIGILLAGFVGYRLGTLRLVASLQAEELPVHRAPELHQRIDRLVEEMRVSRPPVLVADLQAPNALSIGGPRKGVIVIDQGLLRLLTIDELEGILAHELAHMESYDTFVNTLALTAMRTIVGIATLGLLPFVLLLDGVDRSAAWFAGRPRVRFGLATLFKLVVTALVSLLMSVFTLSFLAYSRRQEYAADSRAADVTGDPAALARALSKIHRAKQPRSGLFSLLYIHDDRRDDTPTILSTHPPLPDRIDRLADRVEGDVSGQPVARIRIG